MEEKLSPLHEAVLREFSAELAKIETVDDLFPPDGGVREPIHPFHPLIPGSESVCLAAVYDLAASRRIRQQKIERVARFMNETDILDPINA